MNGMGLGVGCRDQCRDGCRDQCVDGSRDQCMGWV